MISCESVDWKSNRISYNFISLQTPKSEEKKKKKKKKKEKKDEDSD